MPLTVARPQCILGFKWGTLADDVFPSAKFTLPPKPRPPTGPI